MRIGHLLLEPIAPQLEIDRAAESVDITKRMRPPVQEEIPVGELIGLSLSNRDSTHTGNTVNNCSYFPAAQGKCC